MLVDIERGFEMQVCSTSCLYFCSYLATMPPHHDPHCGRRKEKSLLSVCPSANGMLPNTEDSSRGASSQLQYESNRGRTLPSLVFCFHYFKIELNRINRLDSTRLDSTQWDSTQSSLSKNSSVEVRVYFLPFYWKMLSNNTTSLHDDVLVFFQFYSSSSTKVCCLLFVVRFLVSVVCVCVAWSL
jgi:hypothetical protein